MSLKRAQLLWKCPNGHRIKITQSNLMILVSFSSAGVAWFEDVKRYGTFRSQATENPPFRYWFDSSGIVITSSLMLLLMFLFLFCLICIFLMFLYFVVTVWALCIYFEKALYKYWLLFYGTPGIRKECSAYLMKFEYIIRWEPEGRYQY